MVLEGLLGLAGDEELDLRFSHRTRAAHSCSGSREIGIPLEARVLPPTSQETRSPPRDGATNHSRVDRYLRNAIPRTPICCEHRIGLVKYGTSARCTPAPTSLVGTHTNQLRPEPVELSTLYSVD